MDQWLGAKDKTVMAKMPELTVADMLIPEPVIIEKPKPKTFWSEHESKPVVKPPRPAKKEKPPITSRIKTYYEMIKEERETELINRQKVERIPIDWQKVKKDRLNKKYGGSYNAAKNAVHNF